MILSLMGVQVLLLYFKGRSSTMAPSEVLVNDEIVAISDRHLYWDVTSLMILNLSTIILIFLRL